MTEILAINSDNIQRAAQAIKVGELVAMPTETVYGLAADATNDEAVRRIYDAKGRPSFNPLIIHLNDLKQAQKWGGFNAQALMLAQAFWPGPLTLIVPKKENTGLSDLVTAGLETVAIRVPGHDVARALIEASHVPLAAPSANKSGSISPTTPAHVHEGLNGDVAYILAGGACDVGLESTIVDCSADAPVILRHGGVTVSQIADKLACNEVDLVTQNIDEDKPKSPGLLLKHYSPSIPVRLRALDVNADEALLAFGSTKFMSLKGGGRVDDLAEGQLLNLSEAGDLYEAASNLFSMMRILDKPYHRAIAVMDIPNTGIGVAINDRLKRASAS